MSRSITLFNELGFLADIEDLGKAVRVLVDARPDANQLTQRQAHLLQSIAGKQKPALVLMVDTANVYGKTLPGVRYNMTVADPIGPALRMIHLDRLRLGALIWR